MYRARAKGFFLECVGSDLIGSYLHTIFSPFFSLLTCGFQRIKNVRLLFLHLAHALDR